MGKNKFKKRQKKRRLIRGEMTKRGISGRKLAEQLGVTSAAVSKGCATSPRIVAALIEAGVPQRLFKKKPPPDQRQLIREEMINRGIRCDHIAASLGVTPGAVSKGLTTSPRIVAALIEAGMPERMFGKGAPSANPPLTPFYKGGQGDKDHRPETCATDG